MTVNISRLSKKQKKKKPKTKTSLSAVFPTYLLLLRVPSALLVRAESYCYTSWKTLKTTSIRYTHTQKKANTVHTHQVGGTLWPLMKAVYLQHWPHNVRSLLWLDSSGSHGKTIPTPLVQDSHKYECFLPICHSHCIRGHLHKNWVALQVYCAQFKWA